ncbi:MAG: hypothetical protein GY793_08390 [Proteobacteria bacterium]|nr:hypothetical protein [Pseudomonadota bacterium]
MKKYYTKLRVESKKFFQASVIDFLKSEIVLKYKVRATIVIYLISFAILSIGFQLTSANNEFWVGVTVMTTGFILMPFILYFSFAMNEFFRRVVIDKKPKPKRAFKLRAEGVVKTLMLSILYTWICIALMVSLIFVVT